ncbi:MAG TPA: NAD(P)-dependent oxidoreductase [Burkholderiales bacterium]|nr:NAD(P)-dependent oxidoreductase [Burkholderiales bacterium]
MKVLVTGATGFVGRRLCRVVTEAGHEVHALVRPESIARARSKLATAALVAADLASLDMRDLPDRVDAVVSLAQARRFREFPETAEQVFTVNVRAMLTLLQWARGAGVRRFVHVSSGGVYGGTRGTPLRETDRPSADPQGFYLGTKLCAEVLFQNYRQFFEAAVLIRPFFVYGPEQQKEMFVARLIESVRNGAPVQLQGPDGLSMNPVFVDDAAAALGRALGLRGQHLVNVAGPEVVTLRALCDLIGRCVGRAPAYVPRAGDAVDYVADITEMRSKLGPPAVAPEEGIARSLDGTCRP